MGTAAEVAQAAERAVGMARQRGGSLLDYSEQSVATVEEILAEAAHWACEMTSGQLQNLAQDFGCYLLEVARRAYGGAYRWSEARDAPVLVTGEPTCHVAILTWDKVRGRLAGDEADNIPFFYEGFAVRARAAKAGDHVLFV